MCYRLHHRVITGAPSRIRHGTRNCTGYSFPCLAALIVKGSRRQSRNRGSRAPPRSGTPTSKPPPIAEAGLPQWLRETGQTSWSPGRLRRLRCRRTCVKAVEKRRRDLPQYPQTAVSQATLLNRGTKAAFCLEISDVYYR